MIDETVTNAMTPETFDVLNFVSSTAYPTSEVKVYQDSQAAAELLRLNELRKEDAADSTQYDAQIEKMIERVEASQLSFKLRGMPPGVVSEIYALDEDIEEKGDDTDEPKLGEEQRQNNLVAATIVAVRNAAGSVDSRVFTGEDVAQLRRFLKEGEFAKLMHGVINVNFNAAVFDQAVDAGFLS